MTSHPFGSPFPEQLASLEHGMSLLKELFNQHPDLPHPWALSALGASCYFPSTSIVKVGNVLGKEGWTIQRTIIHKEVMGCRIEIQLPVYHRPFEWEAL